MAEIFRAFARFLPKIYQKSSLAFEAVMSQSETSELSKTRLRAKINEYPKLSRSNARLYPYRNEIRALRSRNAAYDDIRLILGEEGLVVSLNTVYRFCRDVLGETPISKPKPRSPKTPIPATPPPPIQQSASHSPASIQSVLEERRERLPGVWGRQKRGPRIADSKNL